MTGYSFDGIHVIADICEIDPDVVNNEPLILNSVIRGIEASGATLCGMQTKRFEPFGLTAIYLLSESHVSIHTYPEQYSLFLDAFTCGTTCDPEEIVRELVRALGPCNDRVTVIRRGQPAIAESLQLALARR